MSEPRTVTGHSHLYFCQGGCSLPVHDCVEAARSPAGPDVAALREALEKYGRHLNDCGVTLPRYSVKGNPVDGYCTCRLTDALLATPPAPSDHGTLDVERLAAAFNDAQIRPAEVQLGRDLRIPAARLLARLERLPAPSDHGALDVERLRDALRVELLILDDEDPGICNDVAIDDSAAGRIAALLAPRVLSRLATPSVPPKEGTDPGPAGLADALGPISGEYDR